METVIPTARRHAQQHVPEHAQQQLAKVIATIPAPPLAEGHAPQVLDKEQILDRCNRILFNFIEGICANDCVWCYKNHLQPRKASLEKTKQFLDINKDSIRDILFMGIGESLEHEDFPLLIQHIVNLGIPLPQFNTSLVTARPFTEDMAKACCSFKNINIEMGGTSQHSKYTNMKNDIGVFENNLQMLIAANEISNIRVKMLVNKNNHRDSFAELQKKYPTVEFYFQTLHVFEDRYLKTLAPELSLLDFIDNNFDEDFPYCKENITPMIYDETRHIFKNAWFIGVDDQLYTCQNMAQMKSPEYQLGDISTVDLNEVRHDPKFKEIIDRMAKCTATPLCGKECPF